MFSTGSLVHFVFANTNDTYFCHHILALDHDRYLWLCLREAGFENVYFLDFEDECTVHSFGGCDRTYNTDKKKDRKNLQKWMEDALLTGNGHRTALVFRLAEFCNCFSRKEWDGFLHDLSSLYRRSGIIVLTSPPEAEASILYLLYSKVFVDLNISAITAIRNAEPCNLYKTIAQNLQDDVTYFNLYTVERVRDILRYLFLTDSTKFVDCGKEDALTTYLYQYLHSGAFQRAEMRKGVCLPDKLSLFQHFCNSLRQETVWKRLVTRAVACAENTDIRAYLRNEGYPFVSETLQEIGVRRSKDGYAHICMTLQLPECRDPKEQQDLQTIRELAEEICEDVTFPKNRMENTALTQSVTGFLGYYESARQMRDFDTLRRILESVAFCMQWIAVPVGSEMEKAVLNNAELLHQYIRYSGAYFKLNQDFYSYLPSFESPTGKRTLQKVMQQREVTRMTYQNALQQYEDIFHAARIKLNLSASLDTLKQLTDSLQDMQESLSEIGNSISETVERDELPQKEEMSEETPQEPFGDRIAEEDFEIPTDWRITPPSELQDSR